MGSGLCLHLLEEVQHSSRWILPSCFRKVWLTSGQKSPQILPRTLSKSCLLGWAWRHKESKVSSLLSPFMFFLPSLSFLMPCPLSTNRHPELLPHAGHSSGLWGCWSRQTPTKGRAPPPGLTRHAFCIEVVIDGTSSESGQPVRCAG